MFVSGCSYIRLKQSVVVSSSDWQMYGGGMARTNVARSEVNPPLKPIWEYDASAGFSTHAVAAADSYLFVGNLIGEIHVIHIRTGKSVGVHDFGSAIVGTPVIDNGRIYVALSRDEESLIAYNLSSGLIEWRARLGEIESSPLLVAGRIIVATLSGKLVCLDILNGTVIWTFDTGSRNRHTTIHSSPASDGQVVIIGTDRGELFAVDINDGKLRWSVTMEGGIVATPSIQSGKVFVGTLAGSFSAFAIESGILLWDQKLDSKIFPSQACNDGQVYIGTSSRTMFCLSTDSGEVIWRATMNGVLGSAPIISGDVLYVGSMDKNLSAFSTKNGDLLWQYKAEGRIKAGPIIHKQYLFALIEDQSVIAFQEK